MAEIKWIKLATNIFDNRKIRQIECLPDGYAIIVVWLKLMCLAGTINDSGMIYLTKEIPYTDQMLSSQFGMPITTIQLALTTFEQFGMVEVVDNILHISNWEKYQSIDRMNEIREYNRLAKQKSREKQKQLQEPSNVNNMSMTSQACHDTDKDKDKDKDKERDTETDKKKNKDPFFIYKESEPDLYVALKDYESMRKAMKKPLTDRSKGMLLSKLGEYPDADWIPMLEQAINHNWLSVYPINGGSAAKPGKNALPVQEQGKINMAELQDILNSI